MKNVFGNGDISCDAPCAIAKNDPHNPTLFPKNNNDPKPHLAGKCITHADLKKINICFWNIRGLTHHKLQSEICGSFSANFDIILLNETWSDEIQTFELEGYVYIDMYRR